ncbi:conserved membrane hypothetical protein [Candidatus Sulfopaludibacter sp. SbA3]|nr:conserved membrane hypothetical protein [Candidatus Sulfopaludibacter sp. SbA3]
MFLFDFFRSFLPLHNPLGFGASDFLLFALASMLVTLVFLRTWLEPFARRFAERTWWCMALLAALPIVLRLALLARHPVPTPGGADDFSYLLLADTLRHFRLANAPHPLSQFFEAVFIVQEPTYSSIFPLGQGIVLALGWLVFGHPWTGVMLSVAALCALCYWMLRAWTTPGWALVGGLLAVMEFGPLNQWMNLYWGGAASAAAGCLVFGALPRLRHTLGSRDAAILGAGLGLQLLSRPFEFVLLSVCVALYFLPLWKQQRMLMRPAGVAALAMLPALVLTLAQNRAVTGQWTTLPYQLSRYQYGVPATFTVQPNPTPHRTLTPEQQLDYQAQCIIHGEGTDSFGSYVERWTGRVHFYRFFFLAPLYLALPFFVAALREFRFLWVLGTLLLFSLGTNFYPYFYPHYIAALTCLMLLVSITALTRVPAASLILFLCTAQFLFWYGIHALAGENLFLAVARYDTGDFVNYGDPEGRIAINGTLDAAQGKQLVFVQYGPQHAFHEWIHNAADIDRAHIVWAADLGAIENDKLRKYYPGRTVWLAQPDAIPPRVIPYPYIAAPGPHGLFENGPVKNSTDIEEIGKH